ncbi:MAG: hypothetical protein NT159_07515 [Proteobacteria bacterium]|nr:hypothetical protein [Pseudomonadota bacterium]
MPGIQPLPTYSSGVTVTLASRTSPACRPTGQDSCRLPARIIVVDYFLLNLTTGNIDGQLLFDLESGKYKPLPKDSRIYVNINTHNFPTWTITKFNLVLVDRSKEDRQSHIWW